MIRDQLSNLHQILSGDLARSTMKNDRVFARILSLRVPNHGTYSIRIETKLPDSTVSYLYVMTLANQAGALAMRGIFAK